MFTGTIYGVVSQRPIKKKRIMCHSNKLVEEEHLHMKVTIKDTTTDKESEIDVFMPLPLANNHIPKILDALVSDQKVFVRGEITYKPSLFSKEVSACPTIYCKTEDITINPQPTLETMYRKEK